MNTFGVYGFGLIEGESTDVEAVPAQVDGKAPEESQEEGLVLGEDILKHLK